MTSQEKKNDRLGMGVSLGIHLALLVLFIFLLAWKEPFPPLPEYGIEVSFGLEEAGSGEVQPTTPVNNTPEPVAEEPAPDEPSANEEVIPEPVTETNVVETQEPQIEEVEEVSDPVEEVEESQSAPNVDPATEEPKEEKIEETPVKKESPKLNSDAAYPNQPANTNGANGTDGSSNTPDNSNQGNEPDEVGDQGDPEGEIDARSLYGKPGGGAGGAALAMSGWNWDFLPKPGDLSNETGQIIFEIKIDDEGEIISVRTIEKSVSDSIVKIYRSEVLKLTFSRTSANSRPAATSTGRITFIIRSK